MATLASKLKETEWNVNDCAKHKDRNMTGNDQLATARREALRPRREGGATPRRTYRFQSKSREDGRPCPPRPQWQEAQRPTEPTSSRRKRVKQNGRPCPPPSWQEAQRPTEPTGSDINARKQQEKPGMRMSVPPFGVVEGTAP